MLLINSKIYRWCEPITDKLLRKCYKLKFAKWYHEQLNGNFKSVTDIQKPNNYNNRYKLYEYVLDSQDLKFEKLNYLEFGVFKGDSIKWWMEQNIHSQSEFYGFDTFQGLPEVWGDRPEGTFSTEGNIPVIDDARCHFEVGLFQDTLPTFLTKHNFTGKVMLHLDADLYSSTHYVLANLAPFLKTGDMLMFDEFTDVLHEFRAFQDFTNSFGLNYELIASVNRGEQIVFEIV